jgi:23S rRNA (cytosine1962-C5)-methyltransferase
MTPGQADESRPDHVARPAGWLDLPADAVLFQDDMLVVVNKPAGVPCQAPDTTQPEDLVSLIKRRIARASGCAEETLYLGTHQRLDQETSGVIVYSLDKAANASLAEQFQGRSVQKLYLAAVSGKPPRPGTLLEAQLVPAADGRMRVARASEPGAKLARTRVLDVEQRGQRSLLTLAIETGRTHQIRVQLAAAGCPIVGDALYGGAPGLRLMLHALRISLQHPTRAEPLVLEAPVPYELRAWLEGKDSPQHVLTDPRLLQRCIALAAGRRLSLLRAYERGETTAFRLLHGDADGLPDIYIDVYDRWLVVRVDSEQADDRSAAERALLHALQGAGFAGAYLKRHPRQANQLVDPKGAQFAPSTPVFGEAAPNLLLVHERGIPYEVQLGEGLRTGLFLDQRDNRALVQELARDKRVLNLFGYTGSFSVAALAAGARLAVTVDVSRAALAWADRNAARIGAADRHRSLPQDAFLALRSLEVKEDPFDLAVLDPPSYSTSKQGRFRVVKDYPALCVATLRVLAPGATLIACVNHHGLSRADLRRFIQAAGRDAGVTFESIRNLPEQRDFPVSGSGEPAMKSLIVRLSTRHGMHGASVTTRTVRTVSRPSRPR